MGPALEIPIETSGRHPRQVDGARAGSANVANHGQQLGDHGGLRTSTLGQIPESCSNERRSQIVAFAYPHRVFTPGIDQYRTAAERREVRFAQGGRMNDSCDGDTINFGCH